MTVTQMPHDEELTQRWAATTIKTVMASRGMRQRDLADAIGMTDAHLSQKLNQKNRISVQDVVEIARALGVAPGELLNGWSGVVPPPLPRLDSNQQPSDLQFDLIEAYANGASCAPPA